MIDRTDLMNCVIWVSRIVVPKDMCKVIGTDEPIILIQLNKSILKICSWNLDQCFTWFMQVISVRVPERDSAASIRKLSLDKIFFLSNLNFT